MLGWSSPPSNCGMTTFSGDLRLFERELLEDFSGDFLSCDDLDFELLFELEALLFDLDELLLDFEELLDDFDLEPELLLRLPELELFLDLSSGFLVDRLMSSDFGGRIGSQTSD